MVKLSGEALAGGQPSGISPETVDFYAREVKRVVDMGTEVALVVGSGNIWRGRQGYSKGMDRATADYMGMLATIINALALQDGLEHHHVPTRVQTAIEMRQVAEPYIRRRAIRHLEKGRVVIFAAGTGNPYFTTDTTAALRAAEIEADAILMQKEVGGVFDSDPKTNPQAQLFDTISYLDIIRLGLQVMDSTAVTLCKDNRIPLAVFDMGTAGNLARVVRGERIGTLVGGEVSGHATVR